MIGSEDRRELRNKLRTYEGQVAHMYLDSKGYVTVGVGHFLPTVAHAQNLSFRDKAGKIAGAEEIRCEYEMMKALPKDHLASYYQRHATLFLSETDIDRLTDVHIDNFYKELRRQYPGFDTFPRSARLALYDMIFNLGLTGLRSSWPSFNEAVHQQDWGRAAVHSRRKAPVSELRNRYVRELFEDAAGEVNE